jgi:hypothetical protein
MLMAGGVAAADDVWQTVTIEDGFTMEIPAVAGDRWKPSAEDAKTGELVVFGVTTDFNGDLICILSRNAYTDQFKQKDADARLATSLRNLMCAGGRADTDISESESLTSNTYQAAHCAASFTDASTKQPGQAMSGFAIAAPKALYMLTCNTSAATKSDAAANLGFWSKHVRHIEASIHLPPQP